MIEIHGIHETLIKIRQGKFGLDLEDQQNCQNFNLDSFQGFDDADDFFDDNDHYYEVDQKKIKGRCWKNQHADPTSFIIKGG